MLTGEHKIGDDGLAIEFGDDDSTLVTLSRCAFNGRSLLCVDIAELRSLHALLSEHFGDGWTPCGPDGPFPPRNAKDEYDVTMRLCSGSLWVEHGLGASDIRLCVSSMNIIAWKPALKPYDPKGQA